MNMESILSSVTWWLLLQAEGDAFFNPNDDGGKAPGAEDFHGESHRVCGGVCTEICRKG